MNKERTLSYILVTLVYALAFIIGVFSYKLFPFHFAINLLLADVISTIVVFIFSVIFKNASMYDPYWSVQPIFIIMGYALSKGLNGPSILAFIAICVWGIRLTLNWAYTFTSMTHQDWRYTMLKEKTQKLYPIVNFCGIHMFPTLVVYLCVLPVVYMIHSLSSINPFTVIFFVFALLSVLLQGVSDYQMHKFKKLKTGGLIRIGLWKYSRHPNYLAEIIMWWAIALLSVISMKDNYWLFIGALVNTLMFVFISIPMAEKRQAKRKEGFTQYKKETRMLLPIYKKVQ